MLILRNLIKSGIAICVALSSLPAFASPDAGAIGEIKGSGVLERDRQVIQGGTGVGVQSMDTAVTAKGKMRIDFVDDTRVDLTDHSRLLIDEFVYDPANDIGSISLKASLGTVRYASGQIAKRYQQNVKIRTPSATIGVRGTDFIMLVDEIGGTMVTLLPSCDTNGTCIVGEISVESDTGFVIMNQAFQTTQIKSSYQKPSKPLVLDLDEKQIGSLLILRKRSPYDEEEIEILKKQRAQFEFLDIDYLEFDDLDTDALTDSIKDIWVTDLMRGTDYYLGELLYDMIDQLNLQLAALFRNELDKQNEQFFADQQFGYDPDTRIELEKADPNYIFRRTDAGVVNMTQLRLSQEGGYIINVEQQGEAILDYRLGAGINSIDIRQNQ
tara:strand:- start:353 stop:1501 length:1149 start_codon:yes stop_codon:yes gene_type:complete